MAIDYYLFAGSGASLGAETQERGREAKEFLAQSESNINTNGILMAALGRVKARSRRSESLSRLALQQF